MSEELLQNLMQLFAIIAKVDGANIQERTVVNTFLSTTLNLEDSSHYLTLFDQYVSDSQGRRPSNGQHRISVRDSSRVLLICNKVNQELTQQQKVTVIFLLFSLIRADGHISPQEFDFLQTTADIFNLSKDEFKLIEQFSLSGQGAGIDHADIAVISANPYNPYQQARHIYLEQALGFFLVLRIKSLNYYLIKYQGNGFYYLNGVQMASGEPYPLVVGSTLRSTRHATLHYTDIIGAFLEDEHTQPVSYQAINISYRFQNGGVGLHPLTFGETGGKLIGIMGPSGAGKSTLLEVLNGNAYPTTGQIYINGHHLHANKQLLKAHIGYVPQDDLLIEELSVYDNVYYALRLSYGDKTHAELDELVTQTLISLGIYEIAHLRVGSVLEKTISGGERKRVNIALELSRAPTVLFFDEPTSGLSSRDSQSIMDLLKELALTGKLVFVVIHQPSSVIFKMFDRLLILDKGGYGIYYGNPLESIIYFKTQINQINREQAVCAECGNVNPEQIFDIVETRTVNQYGRFTNKRKISPQTWHNYYLNHLHQEALPLEKTALPEYHQKPGPFRQFITYLTRDVKAKLNNAQYLGVNLIQAPLLALILALVSRYSSISEKEYQFLTNDNMPVYVFMSVIVALFIGMIVSAEEIYHDRKIRKREAFLSLSRNAYLLSKVTVLMVMSAVQMALFVLVGNTMLGFQGLTLQMWLMLFTTACFANLMGLNISATFKSVATIYIFIPILLIPQLLLGGVVVDYNKINPLLRSKNLVPVIGELMASRWAYEGLMVLQFTENEYEAPLYPFNKTMSAANYRRLHLLPALEAKAEHLLAATRGYQTYKEMRADRLMMARHLSDLRIYGSPYLDQLIKDLQTSQPRAEVYDRIPKELEIIKSRLGQVFTRAYNQKQALEDQWNRTPQGRAHQAEIYHDYYNEAIADVVKNTNERERYLETEDGLVQVIDAVYHDPEPRYLLDFRAHFYSPIKHMLGIYMGTFWFNLLVVWFMGLGLYVTLYFDVFRRGLKRMTISFRKLKKRRSDEA